MNQIDAALKIIEKVDYTGALKKIRNDIVAKTNGCAETGWPEKTTG